jgi:hypothetical protein
MKRLLRIFLPMTHETSPTWDATNFQFFDDDAGLGLATSKANENIAVTNQALDENFRLRLDFGERADATQFNVGAPTLEFAIDGGSFTAVGSGTAIQWALSSHFANADNDSTQRLTGVAGTATYQGTWMEGLESSQPTTNQTWTDDGTEYEFCLTADSGQLSGGEVITFRWSITTTTTPDGDDADVPLATVPTITLASAAGEEPAPAPLIAIRAEAQQIASPSFFDIGFPGYIAEHAKGVQFSSAQHRQYHVNQGAFSAGALETDGTVTATGTITSTGDLAATNVTRAFGTITVTGDLVATGTTNAYGTITALGIGLSEGTHNAFGVTTFIGELIAGGGVSFAFGTSTFSADLSAVGTNLGAELPPEGQSIVIPPEQPQLAIQPVLRRGFPDTEIVTAAGTITVTGDLVADNVSLALGTSTITGDLVSRGTTNAYGTITALGQGLSEGTHLAQGTITASAEVAASGTHLAGGTSTFSGQVIASGTDITAGGDAPPEGQALLVSEIPQPRDQSIIPVGINAEPVVPDVYGKITVIGSLSAAVGNVQVTGTITVTGALTSKQPVDLFNIAATTIFTDEVPIPPQYVFLQSGPPPSKRATATIRWYAILDAGENLTFLPKATITVSGDLAAASEGVVHAAGTITATGSLDAVGVKTLVSATATITVFGTAVAKPGPDQSSATIGVIGQLSALGTALTPQTTASGTITVIGKLEGDGASFCPITAKGLISVTGDLSAFEDSTDDIVPITASIGVSGGLQASLYHYAAGGNLLAKGTITVKTGCRGYFHKVTCITPTATFAISGATLSAGFTDSNLFLKTGTFTISATLDVSAIYARASQLSIPGELTALGRNLPFGHLATESDEADFTTFGQIGPGTIDGQKKAIIRQDFGSLELYNNSQGGFYSIGGAQLLKEGFALINWAINLSAKGSRDQILYRSGTITVTSDLDAVGEHTSVSGSINQSGSVNAGGGTTFAQASISVSASIAAIGDEVAIVWNLTDTEVADFYISSQSSQTAEAGIKIDNDGFVYIRQAWQVGSWQKVHELTDWIIPQSAAGGPYNVAKVRATKISGFGLTGSREFDIWYLTAFDTEFTLSSTWNGLRETTFLLELSLDDGATILTSATIKLTANSIRIP